MPIVTNGLIHYWNGKDGVKAGNVLRNLAPSQTAKNMQLTGGTVLANGAIALNGTTNYASFPASESMFTTNASPYTMELIYTPRVFSGDHAIWTSGVFLGTFTWGKLYWEFARNTTGNTAGQANTVAAMNTASPLRMAVVYNGSSAQIYVNNTLTGTASAGTAHAFSAGGYTTSFIAGGVANIPNYQMDLHAVRVYNRALTSAELTTNWNEGINLGITLADTTPPAEVPTLTQTNTFDSVTLNWTKPSDSDFSHVRILRNGTQIVNNVTTTTYTDSGLLPNTSYTYLVKAVDTSGNESAGKTLVVTTANATVIQRSVIEGFEDGTFNFTRTNGTYPWTYSSGLAPNGESGYLMSGNKDIHSSTSITTFNIVVPPEANNARLEVDWAVSSEEDWDFFRIHVNGTQELNTSGTKQGTFTKTALASGMTHTLQLSYFKDDGLSVGTDAGYITGIRLYWQEFSDTDKTPPTVEIVNVSRSKLSSVAGMNSSVITMKFSEDILEWKINLNGVNHTTGVTVESGGAATVGTEVNAIIYHSDLNSQGANRLNIYGKDTAGNWTAYTQT